MKPLPSIICLIACLAPSAVALGQRDVNPLDELPPYIRKINDWGQRADFSHDGKRILLIERTYGDAFELNLASGNVTPVTHHYYHGGYTRALYLANGDILLSGCTDFDADNPHLNRYDKNRTHRFCQGQGRRKRGAVGIGLGGTPQSRHFGTGLEAQPGFRGTSTPTNTIESDQGRG